MTAWLMSAASLEEALFAAVATATLPSAADPTNGTAAAGDRQTTAAMCGAGRRGLVWAAGADEAAHPPHTSPIC